MLSISFKYLIEFSILPEISDANFSKLLGSYLFMFQNSSGYSFVVLRIDLISCRNKYSAANSLKRTARIFVDFGIFTFTGAVQTPVSFTSFSMSFSYSVIKSKYPSGIMVCSKSTSLVSYSQKLCRKFVRNPFGFISLYFIAVTQLLFFQSLFNIHALMKNPNYFDKFSPFLVSVKYEM